MRRGCCVRVVTKSFAEEVTCEQTRGREPGGGYLEKSILVKGNSQCKCPEARAGLRCLRPSGGNKGERVGDDVRGNRSRWHRRWWAIMRTLAISPSEMETMEASEQRRDMNWLRFKRVSAV